jgi:hypothetical protein
MTSEIKVRAVAMPESKSSAGVRRVAICRGRLMMRSIIRRHCGGAGT